ncbi:MAG TPA: hypothetical protein VJM76_02095, partial [Gammaproteobacteria bacterium]|nr:hypothetical protein [Gammaproteobacteria bacterium]
MRAAEGIECRQFFTPFGDLDVPKGFVKNGDTIAEHATLDVYKDGTVELAEYDAFRLRLKDLDNLMLSGTLKSTTTASPGARESQGAS